MDRPEAERSLREQIERAVIVQQSLLPDVSGSVGGFRLAAEYLPCESLAGDFYDICRRPGCVTLMVADVMGHGAEAALLTPILKTVFQDTAPSISDPGALLKEMNERLHGLIPAGTFAATTVARLDPSTSEVLLANSGQPYPIVLRASKQEVDVICAAGVPLGLFKNGDSYEYAVHRLDLAPGDVLLMASDGIGAIEDGTGQCFEDHGLFTVLSDLSGFPGEKVLKALVAEAVEFSNGLPFPDDISMVAVTRDHQSSGH
jgi:serine phosphatase RsbU (regulator of sigma subunit)